MKKVKGILVDGEFNACSAQKGFPRSGGIKIWRPSTRQSCTHHKLSVVNCPRASIWKTLSLKARKLCSTLSYVGIEHRLEEQCKLRNASKVMKCQKLWHNGQLPWKYKKKRFWNIGGTHKTFVLSTKFRFFFNGCSEFQFQLCHKFKMIFCDYQTTTAISPGNFAEQITKLTPFSCAGTCSKWHYLITCT